MLKEIEPGSNQAFPDARMLRKLQRHIILYDDTPVPLPSNLDEI